MRKQYIKKRRVIESQSITKQGLSIPLREFIDRQCQGKAINARMAEHKPLPPDGEDTEDFERGTRQFLDINDVHELNQEIEQFVRDVEDKQAKEQKEKEDKAFSDAVQAEIDRRDAEARERVLNTASA